MEIHIDYPLDAESKKNLMTYVQIISKCVFYKEVNPVDLFYVGDLEKKLLDFMDEDEKQERLKINAEKDVFTIGKTINEVRAGYLIPSILLSSFLLGSPGELLLSIAHEMTHARDFTLYFEKTDKSPFLKGYVPGQEDYYAGYEYWSEFNANRNSLMILQALDVPLSIDFGSLSRDFSSLMAKADRVKLEGCDRSQKMYIARVAMMDFNSRFLTVCGMAAADKKIESGFLSFIESDPVKMVFGNALIDISEVFDCVCDSFSYDKLMDYLPEILDRFNSANRNFMSYCTGI